MTGIAGYCALVGRPSSVSARARSPKLIGASIFYAVYPGNWKEIHGLA